MRSPKRIAGPFLAALAVTVAASCADQAAGERCDIRNGNGDCESGLECVPASSLVSLRDLKSDRNVGLCCPEESTATEPACDRRKDIGSGSGGAGSAGAGGGGAGGAPDAAAPDASPEGGAAGAPGDASPEGG